MVLQLQNSLVTIASINLEKLVTFYTSLVGEASNYIPNIYAEFQLPGSILGIFKPKTTNEGEFKNATQSTMSLCLEVNNLEEAIVLLTNLGYPPPGVITTASHGREIYAYDPEGNRIILHQAF
ncbi:MAG: glyoxalase [Calothrix sp. C42_A2020_038]|nr:glyoxalase [Calothrix sp. C42_A2020_038]